MKKIIKKIICFSCFAITIFNLFMSPCLLAKAIENDILYDDESNFEIDNERDFDLESIIVVLNSNYSQYCGISNYISQKIYSNQEVISIENLSELPSDLLVNETELISSNNSLINHLKNIEFKQILKINLSIQTEKGIIDLVRKIEKFEEFFYVGPNYVCDTNYASSNDVLYDDQWSLKDYGGVHVDDAWNFSTGSNKILVGVIDSGIALHNDLNSNVVEGKDYFNNNTITSDDYIGHGTSVAGIIGAKGNNNFGISGINQEVSIVPLQTIIDLNGSKNHHIDSIVLAIQAARDTYYTANPISVINCSLSNINQTNDILSAIENYPGLFVWSAGNTGIEKDEYENFNKFNLDNLISVGALDSNNERATWYGGGSNYGNAVDIYAPGKDVLTTYLTSKCAWDVVFPDGYRLCELQDRFVEEYFNYIENGVTTVDGTVIIEPNRPEQVKVFLNARLSNEEDKFSSHHLEDGYHTLSGTSFSAPHVTGVAALLLSISPYLNGSDLKTAILESADIITISVPDTSEGASEGDVVFQNVRKLNAYNAVIEVLDNFHLHSYYRLNSDQETSITKTISSDASYFDDLNGFYELILEENTRFEFNILSNHDIEVKLFDEEFNELNYIDKDPSNNNIKFDNDMFNGKYYLKVKYVDENDTGTININIKPINTTSLNVGDNEILDDYRYGIEEYIYTNTLSSGFYKITLNAETISGSFIYQNSSIQVYEDINNEDILTRLETIYFTLEADTNGDINNIIVFLEYGKTYYFNFNLPNNYNYSSIEAKIERLLSIQGILPFDSDENFILEQDTTQYGDFIQAVEIMQSGYYEISYIHEGNQSGNLQETDDFSPYLYYIFYKEVSTLAEQLGDIQLMLPQMAITMGDTQTFSLYLEAGIYYIGYYNKLSYTPITIAIQKSQ